MVSAASPARSLDRISEVAEVAASTEPEGLDGAALTLAI
jgi:hypothetical protein